MRVGCMGLKKNKALLNALHALHALHALNALHALLNLQRT
jgi:hypothetical protein